MFRLLVTQFKKLFQSPLFYCSIFAVTILCSFSELTNEFNSNALEGEGDVIVSCLSQYTGEQIQSDISFCAYNVFSVGGSGKWMQLFIPVLAAIAAINIFSDEREYREKRLTIFRIGKKKYYIGNILFFLITGVLVAVLGYFLFAVYANICFPGFHNYSKDMVDEYIKLKLKSGTLIGNVYASHGLFAVYALQFVSFGMYGAMSALPAMLLAAFVRNKYIITCVPFFLFDVVRQIANVFLIKGASNLDYYDYYYKISIYLSPGSVIGLFTQGEYMKAVAIIWMTLILAFSILTFVIMGLGVDKGE